MSRPFGPKVTGSAGVGRFALNGQFDTSGVNNASLAQDVVFAGLQFRSNSTTRLRPGVPPLLGLGNADRTGWSVACLPRSRKSVLPALQDVKSEEAGSAGGNPAKFRNPAQWPGFVCQELGLKIVVTVKLVPDTNADKRIDPATKRLVRTGVETVLNPFDEYAIEAALQLKDKLADDSTVTIVTMAPESGKEIVRKALAMGADDAVMLADPASKAATCGARRTRSRTAKKAGLRSRPVRHAVDRCDHGRSAGHAGRISRRPGLTYAREDRCRRRPPARERETDTGYQRSARRARAR